MSPRPKLVLPALPTASEARAEILHQLALELIGQLGPGAALLLVAQIEELVGELQPQPPSWLRGESEAS